MSKREHESEDTSRPPKRARPDHAQPTKPAEEIWSSRQLQDLLAFRQDGVQELRHGIASLKAFLENILYNREDDNRGRHLSIFRDFLDSQKPKDPQDTERPFLTQLWQAWSFANQNNNDYLASSLCAIFALILKTVSSLLDFREIGALLCRTILQHQHLRLVKRSLDAPKHKDFLISPSLRLLTELTSFDGGVFAREVYKRREQTFDLSALRKHLGLFKTDVSEEEAKRKPAMRTLTVRYILTHLKYQTEGGKIDILKQRPLCGSLFQYVREDPADLVLELLRTTEQNVFKDKTLPRSAKAALLTQQHLERVTELATRSESSETVANAALNWLKAISTNSSYGVLRASGWYPPGTTKAEHNLSLANDTIDLGIDSLEFYEDAEHFQVRNTTLLSWILSLRPQSDAKERELVLTCFKSAPELVHAYFREKGFQLDPKLTNTWIGYASFVFEVIRLPAPARVGHTEDSGFADVPPQTSIVLDSIIPKPLTQKVLTRCLNQSNTLVTFFALRLTVLAFQKLVEVQSQFKKAATTSANARLWNEASDRLQDRFTEQCPKIKDVINTFRQTPDDQEHILQREAVTRLLSLYFEVIPVQALEEHFDVSGALTAALIREESPAIEDGELNAMRSLELEHLLSVARHSTGMRWFHTQGGLKFSPFVTLLRLHTKQSGNALIRIMLGDVLREQGLLNDAGDADKASPLEALVASVAALDDDNDSVYTFLDDCLSRGSRQPVKYLDSLDQQKRQSTADSMTPSLLVEVIREQAPFAAEKLSGTSRASVMAWMQQLLSLLALTSDAGSLLDSITANITKLIGGKKSKQSTDLSQLLAQVRIASTEESQSGPTESFSEGDVNQALPFPSVPIESPNHPEIFKWQQKDLDIAIEDGDIDALMLCLCSEHTDIRHQARVQLNNLVGKVQASDLETKDQLRILFGELLETFEQHSADTQGSPLPYLVGTFATRTLHVLIEPTHFMYPKINRYLMRSPQWRINRLPGYWMENTILSQPEEDDAYWKEVQWVADWLVDGLRTAGDMDLLRRTSAFERVMALYASPAASDKLVRTRVLELVFRAAVVDANTLVTRTGCLAWLETIGSGGVQKKLREFVLEKADKSRLKDWAGVEVDGNGI